MPLYHPYMGDMRIVFMGTPNVVVPILQATERIATNLDADIVAVYTGPDRPAGRGRKLTASPVKEYALTRGYDVLTPARVTNEDEIARFETIGADLVILAAYGLLLPAPFLFGPTHGTVNVHPSLLPTHRGASPVAGALLAGDRITGTTIITMDEGLDTGPVLAMEEIALDGTERTPELTERLFALGARLLESAVPAYVRAQLRPRPQTAEGASVIRRFKKSDSDLDFSRPAAELERRVRALDPWPGTATTWRGERLDVLAASVLGESNAAGASDVVGGSGATPGTAVTIGNDIAIATGEGLLLLERVRPAGKNAMAARDFVRTRAEFVGAVLPS
jgi:methionyl-tRNA formyltransferase